MVLIYWQSAYVKLKYKSSAATMRCYMNDTLFMIGGTTNSKGKLELKFPHTE